MLVMISILTSHESRFVCVFPDAIIYCRESIFKNWYVFNVLQVKDDAISASELVGSVCTSGPDTFPSPACEITPREKSQSTLQWDCTIHQTLRGRFFNILCCGCFVCFIVLFCDVFKFVEIFSPRTREMPPHQQERRPVKSDWRERWATQQKNC